MSCSINEDLGQVEYIFSDKTGTLTCNKMEFRYVTIGNQCFGEAESRERKPTISKAMKSMSRRDSIAFEKSDVMFSFKDEKLKSLLK